MTLETQDARVVSSYGKGSAFECQEAANLLCILARRDEKHSVYVAMELVMTARCDAVQDNTFKPLRRQLCERVGPAVYGQVVDLVLPGEFGSKPISDADYERLQTSLQRQRDALHATAERCSPPLDRLMSLLGLV